jgi:hypothetical protein
LHVILDNYATHKKQEVKDWIVRRNKQHQKAYGGRTPVVFKC